MERELHLGQQKILFDREATVVLYRDTFTVADGDWCGCASCKNFASQRGKIYPGAFLQFLKELGINPLGSGKRLTMISIPETQTNISMVVGFCLLAN
jgi:hypothetical protein